MTDTDFLTACTNCTARVSFDMPEEFLNVIFLRKKTRLIMEILDIDPRDIGDLEVILGELTTNVLRHARGTRFQVQVEMDRSRNQVTITVIDDGIGFVPDVVPPPGTPRSATLAVEAGAGERIGGYGLPLVRSIADRVEIMANQAPLKGMTIRAVKYLQITP